MNPKSINVGDYVAWKWLNSIVEGVVIEIVPDRVEISSKGKRIVRKGTKDNPAIIIQHKKGNQVLKLSSELIETKE